MELPVPPGWRELEEHLEYRHGQDRTAVEGLDSEELRRLHRRLHQNGIFTAGWRHSHVERT